MLIFPLQVITLEKKNHHIHTLHTLHTLEILEKNSCKIYVPLIKFHH